MITSIYINNFKSLQDCSVSLDKLTCLVGLNGAGKSTLLQACGFIAAVMRGEEAAWLNERHWHWKDLGTKLPSVNDSAILHFMVAATLKDGRAARWMCRYNAAAERCTEEHIEVWQGGSEDWQEIVTFKNRRLTARGKTLLLQQRYTGSVLSSVQTKFLPTPALELRDLVGTLKSFDLLSPQGMRSSSRRRPGQMLGADGGQIAAYIAAMPEGTKSALVRQLKKFFPTVTGIGIYPKPGGYCELKIRQAFGSTEIETEARQCSDGLLRVLGILTALNGPESLLCFDEIENGISFDLTAAMADELASTDKQILITTHDMLLVNCLPQASVRLVVKDNGITRVVPFNRIPELVEKAQIFNAGDALLSMTLEDISAAAIKAEAT